MTDGARSRKRITGFSLFGMLKWLRLRVTGREIVVSGECLMCGNCCRALNLTLGNRWIRSKTEFARLLRKYPEYERFEQTGYTVTGIMKFTCRSLTDDGLCGDYENRPDFCRLYPETSICFMGGELPETCGYKFQTAPSFSRMLRREAGAAKTGSDDEKHFNSSDAN